MLFLNCLVGWVEVIVCYVVICGSGRIGCSVVGWVFDFEVVRLVVVVLVWYIDILFDELLMLGVDWEMVWYWVGEYVEEVLCDWCVISC